MTLALLLVGPVAACSRDDHRVCDAAHELATAGSLRPAEGADQVVSALRSIAAAGSDEQRGRARALSEALMGLQDRNEEVRTVARSFLESPTAIDASRVLAASLQAECGVTFER